MNTTKSPTYHLLALGILVLLASCNPQTKKAEPSERDNEIVKDVSAPEDIISLDEAKKYCENYERRRVPSIVKFETAQSDSDEKFAPTQFIAFNLDSLKNYIAYVEQEAKKVNVAPDSLRIYLANYGKEGRYTNQNTVFILPTTKVGGDYGGFYIDGDEAKLIRNFWPKDENGGQD